MEWKRGEFTISDDREKLDLGAVTKLLGETYWGHRRPPQIIPRLIENSMCFSLFSKGEQIGFARLVTDRSVFSWLSDLVIQQTFRGKGLGRWFMGCILSHPDVSGTQFVLQTRTAHKFYEDFGFERNEKLITRWGSAKKEPG